MPARRASPPTMCSSPPTRRTGSSGHSCGACTTSTARTRKTSPDYGRIVNERHYDRLAGLLDAGGFEAVVTGGVGNRDDRYLAPTVLAGVDPAAAVMQDEIFGPILPVIAVKDVDEAVTFVNDRPHPLALYVFTKDRRHGGSGRRAHVVRRRCW